MPRVTSTPECHPETRHYAKGMCRPCYMSRYNENNRERAAELHAAWRFNNRERALEIPRQWRKDNPERVRASQRRYKARLYDAESVYYATLDIFIRDGWVCQLCLEPVDHRLPRTDPMGPTIDHIIPVSLKGSDTPENVQLAHSSCNQSKGNRI